jgi:phosphoglycolate phosphatase-like HAD superfamily hydrolase
VKGQGGTVVIVTSAKKDDLPALLAPLRSEDLIDSIIDGEDAERAKPHPDLFSLALDRSELPPSSVLALGDAVWDVEAAGRAGINCIGVKTGGFSEAELGAAGALAVYRSCADLLAQWAGSPLAPFFVA